MDRWSGVEVFGEEVCKIDSCHCEERSLRRSNLLDNGEIAHLHCTERSAVQVSGETHHPRNDMPENMLPSNIKALILDMDGVLWKADAPIGDLPSIFQRIKSRGLKYVFATNNGTKTPEQYAEKLKELGVDAEPWQVVTSALGVAHMLSQKFPSGTKVFMIGEDGVYRALKEKSFEVLPVVDAQDAQVVVMGLDSAITFDKMREATLLVKRGIPFYGTNPDKTFPTPRGEIPGAGAWISVITTATDVEPIYAGKPYPYMMELSLEILGTKKEETLVVGDRLETDIAAGQAVGCPTALVLSGVATLEQANQWKPEIDIIANDLSDFIED